MAASKLPSSRLRRTALPGIFDFEWSTLAGRLHEQGMTLAFDLGFRRPPPAETAFLHRKLGGTFMLCARLKARFDAAALAAPFLEEAPTGLASAGS